MDISRLKRVLAGLSVATIVLTEMGINTAVAAYTDVPAGIWYEDAVQSFVDAGYLDASQSHFRGGDLANRAEFVKLLVELNGGILSTPPAQPSFDDVKASAWYYGYMEEAGKEGWVKGDNNCYGSHPCYSRPSANINRAEAAALIVRAFALDPTGDASQFVDNPKGQWYTQDIQTAADHCVLQGDDSTARVRPSDNMNRAEMVVMLNRVDQDLTFGVDCGKGQSTAPGVTDASATDAKTVEVEFNVKLDQATAEMTSHYKVTGSPEHPVSSAKLINDKTVELTMGEDLDADKEYTVTVTDMKTSDGKTFSDSATFTGFSALPKGNGVLEVSVSSKNPMGDTVPKGANGVTMLSLDLTASCADDVVIEDITVLHEGFGDESDIDGLYIAKDGGRISRKRTIDSEDQTSDIHLTHPITIKKCGSVTIDLDADFASTAQTSAEHNLVVELPSDFQSNAKDVKGNFPLRGNTFRVAAVGAGSLTVTYNSVTPDEVNVGDKDVVVGKFQVNADSVEDQTIYSMTFEQNGSAADGDVTNIRIRRTDGTIISNSVASTVGDTITLTLNPPFTIKQGDKLTFEIIGDIEGGAAETVIFHFEETSDLFAVGSLYGYGINGQLYGSKVSIPNDTPDTVSIDAGEFTVEINGPVQQAYTRSTNDAVLANVILTTGGDDVDVRQMYLAIEGVTGTGAALIRETANTSSTDSINEVLENVTLRNTKTGRSVQAVRLTNGSDSGIGQNGSTFQVYRVDDFSVTGKQTYEVRVDFIDNGDNVSPKNGDQFKVHICGEPKELSDGTNPTGCTMGGLVTTTVGLNYQMKVEGLSTGDAIHDVRPRSTISGNFQRIATPSLTIAVTPIGDNDTAVANSKNVTLLRFEARAGEAEDLLLTKASFASQSGSLNNGQNYTLWADTDGDGKVDTILQKGVAAQNGKVTFNDLTGGGFNLASEITGIFEVHSDIAASLTNDDLQIKFDVDASDYVEAEEADDGTSLSGINTNGGGDSSDQIIVKTVTSQLWSLVGQGDLFVTKDSISIRNRQLLGGSLGEAVLRLQFHASNEDIDVTDIQLNSSGSNASTVDRFELYLGEATVPFASANANCGSDDVLTVNPADGSASTAFCANMDSRQLIVKKGDDVKVVVRPRMKTDLAGAVPNQTIQLFVTEQAVSNNATGSGAIRARGDQSSNNLVANNGVSGGQGEVFIGTASPASNARVVGLKNSSTLSKITSITNANTDPNNSNVPTGVSDIGKFKVTAAANGNSKNGYNKVTLSGVIFNVNATSVAIENGSSLVMYNDANASIRKTCTPQTTGGSALLTTLSGSFIVVCNGLIADPVATEVDQGTFATFVLQANVLSAPVNSALQVSLQKFDSISNTTFGATTSHFDWVDQDNDSSTTARFFWVEYSETTIKSTSYQN